MKALVVALLVTGCANARHWTTTDLAIEGTFDAALAVDGVQTEGIVSHCQEYNPVIGACGQRMPPVLYLVTTALVHAAISAVLPQRARALFQGVTIGVEAHTVYFNSIVPDQPRTSAH